MPNLHCRLGHIVSLIVCAGILAGNAGAAESDPDGRLYAPSPDPVSDVRQALERAAREDRRALVILGGNWCHDSRALAARLNRSPLDELVRERYELVFVDVGYLDKGRDVLDQLGVAHFYATPTVLIVDPASGQVVNDEDRHMWGNAYNIDMDSSARYFEKWATNEPADEAAIDSAALRELYAQIDRFERQQAERLTAGYAVVGPMLEAYKAGNPPEEFRASWNELRDFRTAIPGDILELRAEAQRRVTRGDEDIQLEFPVYPPLSWETE